MWGKFLAKQRDKRINTRLDKINIEEKRKKSTAFIKQEDIFPSLAVRPEKPSLGSKFAEYIFNYDGSSSRMSIRGSGRFCKFYFLGTPIFPTLDPMQPQLDTAYCCLPSMDSLQVHKIKDYISKGYIVQSSFRPGYEFTPRAFKFGVGHTFSINDEY